jgi:hypothetical protein
MRKGPDGPANAGQGHPAGVTPGGAGVPRPLRWGGFRVLPSRVEFWQELADGLRDRIRYRTAGRGWITDCWPAVSWPPHRLPSD